MKSLESSASTTESLFDVLPEEILEIIGNYLNYKLLFNIALMSKSNFVKLSRLLVNRATERFLIREFFFKPHACSTSYGFLGSLGREGVKAQINTKKLTYKVTTPCDVKMRLSDFNVEIPVQLALRDESIENVQVKKHFSTIITNKGLYALEYKPIVHPLSSWLARFKGQLYTPCFIKQLSIGFLPNDILFWPSEISMYADIFTPYYYGQLVKNLCVYAYIWRDRQYKKLKVNFSTVAEPLENMKIMRLIAQGTYLQADCFDHSTYQMKCIDLLVESVDINESDSINLRVPEARLQCTTAEKAYDMLVAMSKPSKTEGLLEVYKQYEQALISKYSDDIFTHYVSQIKL